MTSPSGCKRNLSQRVLPASIPSPTTAPASARFSHAREKRGPSTSAYGAHRPTASRAPTMLSGSAATQSFQLVEGKVAKVGEGGGRIYLNFADDWRSDFTISIERKDVQAFAASGIDLKGLAGKHVRVRGWIEWRNGPMVAATHPEQLELLPAATPHCSVKTVTHSSWPGLAGRSSSPCLYWIPAFARWSR